MCGVVGGLIFAANGLHCPKNIALVRIPQAQQSTRKNQNFGTKSQVTLLRGARAAPEAEPNPDMAMPMGPAPGLTDSDPTHTCECFCILISVLTVTFALRTLMSAQRAPVVSRAESRSDQCVCMCGGWAGVWSVPRRFYLQ